MQTAGNNQASSSGPMRSVLEKQCSAVWRLTHDGAWQVIHLTSNANIGPRAQIAELFASICLTQLASGTNITARFGNDMLIASVDGEGVLVSLKERGGNPIMIKTAMSRLETRSRRGTNHVTAQTPAGAAAHVQAPQPSAAASTRSTVSSRSAMSQAPQPAHLSQTNEVIPTLDFDRTASQRSSGAGSQHAEPADDGLISFEDPSSGEWSEAPDTGVELDDSGHVNGSRSRSAAPQPNPEAADALAFEIVFTDEEEDESHASVVSMESARFMAGCKWEDVADFISEISAEAVRHLGRSVTSNYWREAIAEFGALDGRVSVSALGRVSIGREGVDVTPREAEALSRAVDAWKARAERAVGDVDKLIPAIKLMPWTTANSREEVR